MAKPLFDGGAGGLQAKAGGTRPPGREKPVMKMTDTFRIFRGPAPQAPNSRKKVMVPPLKPFPF